MTFKKFTGDRLTNEQTDRRTNKLEQHNIYCVSAAKSWIKTIAQIHRHTHTQSKK